MDESPGVAEHSFESNNIGRTKLRIQKWSTEWVQIHRKAVDIDELLPFFRGKDVDYCSRRNKGVFQNVLQRKKTTGAILPEPEFKEQSLLFYSKCLTKANSDIGDITVTTMLQNLAVSNEQTMFWLPGHPWITVTPEVPPEVIDGKLILFHCEILSDEADWSFANGEYVPHKVTLNAIRRKISSTLFIIEQSIPNWELSAYIFLGRKDGDTLYEEIHNLTESMKYTVQVELETAAAMYKSKILDCLSDNQEDGYGEYWEGGQQKGVHKVGSFVFNVAGRGNQSCIGRIVEIKANGSMAKVWWNGCDSPSRKATKISSLFPVPVANPRPPTEEGQMAVICGGFLTTLYGTRVKVKRISPLTDQAVVCLNKHGNEELSISLKYLHSEIHTAKKRAFVRCYSGPTIFPGRTRMGQMLAGKLKNQRGRFRYYYHVGQNSEHEKKDNKFVSCESADFFSLPDSDLSESSSVETDFLDEFHSLLSDDNLLREFKERNKLIVGGYHAKQLIQNSVDGKFDLFFSQDHVDIWVQFLRYRTPLKPSGIHIVDSTWFPLFFDSNGMQNLHYFGGDSSNLDTFFQRYVLKSGLSQYKPTLILIPVLSRYHWSLVALANPYSENAFALHVDSLSTTFDSNMLRFDWSIIQRFLGSMCEANSNLLHIEVKNAPKQSDGCNCGPFVLFFMEALVTEFQNHLLIDKQSQEICRQAMMDVFSDLSLPKNTINRLRTKIAELCTAAMKKSDSCTDYSF